MGSSGKGHEASPTSGHGLPNINHRGYADHPGRDCSGPEFASSVRTVGGPRRFQSVDPGAFSHWRAVDSSVRRTDPASATREPVQLLAVAAANLAAFLEAVARKLPSRTATKSEMAERTGKSEGRPARGDPARQSAPGTLAYGAHSRSASRARWPRAQRDYPNRHLGIDAAYPEVVCFANGSH